MATTSLTDALRIWLFVPNLIGYLRIICTLWSYAVAFHDPQTCLVLYVVGFVLDAVDGHMARLLGQSTKFGAVLDMLIDRAATAGFVLMLSHLMGPMTAFSAAVLVALDIASHFARMYWTMAGGMESHKDTSSSCFTLLDWYYGKKWVMLLLCIGQEAFYLLLYAQYSAKVSSTDYFMRNYLSEMQTGVQVCFVPFMLKQLCNVLQLIDALHNLAYLDAAQRAKAGSVSRPSSPAAVDAAKKKK